MKKIMLLTLAVVASGFMFGCGQSTASELKEIVERQLKAAQEEKIDLFLADVDESIAEAERPVLKLLFDSYDLTYKLVSFKLISSTDKTAEVEVIQETRKVSGPEFRNNRTTAIHTFTKGPSGWKMTGSKIKNMEML